MIAPPNSTSSRTASSKSAFVSFSGSVCLAALGGQQRGLAEQLLDERRARAVGAVEQRFDVDAESDRGRA